MLIISLIVLLTLLGVWLSTIRIYEPPHGEWSATTIFKKIYKVYGPGIENRDWGKIKDEDGKKIEVKIELKPEQKVAGVITIWPMGIFTFQYKYARFMTYAEAKAKNRILAWEPQKRKRELAENKELPSQVRVLAENVEEKQSLKVYEREEFELDFISKDRLIGIKEGYIEFIVFDFPLATTSVVSFKTDAISHIKNLFYKWAEGQSFTEIQKVTYDTFAEKLQKNGKKLKDEINAGIVRNGVIVNTIYFKGTNLHFDSLDVIEEQEGITKDKIGQQRADEQGKARIIKATADAKVVKINAGAEAEKIKIEGDAKNEIQVSLLKKETDVRLEVIKKIIDKRKQFITEIAPIEDKTALGVSENLGQLKGVLVAGNMFSNKGSAQTEKELVDELLGHAIHDKIKEVQNEKN